MLNELTIVYARRYFEATILLWLLVITRVTTVFELVPSIDGILLILCIKYWIYSQLQQWWIHCVPKNYHNWNKFCAKLRLQGFNERKVIANLLSPSRFTNIPNRMVSVCKWIFFSLTLSQGIVEIFPKRALHSCAGLIKTWTFAPPIKINHIPLYILLSERPSSVRHLILFHPCCIFRYI